MACGFRVKDTQFGDHIAFKMIAFCISEQSYRRRVQLIAQCLMAIHAIESSRRFRVVSGEQSDQRTTNNNNTVMTEYTVTESNLKLSQIRFKNGKSGATQRVSQLFLGFLGYF